VAVKVALDAAGEGQPLVLLHGLGASRRQWHRVTPLLSGDRLVLAPDLPGFGDSEPAGPGFDFDAVSDALAQALAEHVDGRFDLLGTSLGGAVALRFALAHPDLVRRLVLSAPAGFAPVPWGLADAAGVLAGPALGTRRIAGVPLSASPAARRLLLWGAVAEPARLSASDTRLILRGSGRATRLGPALAAVLRADHRPLLARLGAPLGLIWGERDRVVPFATLESIRALRPDVIAETIPRAAHIPQLERPAEFAAAVRRVLARLGTG
jgi:pimeloyl-ACP methyl ester carboxylesterase